MLNILLLMGLMCVCINMYHISAVRRNGKCAPYYSRLALEIEISNVIPITALYLEEAVVNEAPDDKQVDDPGVHQCLCQL